MNLGASSRSPVYFGLGANRILKFSALQTTKCIKWSRAHTAGFVEYVHRAPSTDITNVVGSDLLPNANLPAVMSTLKKNL